MKDIELWKPIKGWEQYEVSNMGRVRSKNRFVTQFWHKRFFQRIMGSRILKPRKQNGGYLMVWLSKDGKSKAMTIHRLVATAFLGEGGKCDVNHKDGNKQNNCVSNLEWTTRSNNIKHCYQVLKRVRNTCRVMCVETGLIYDSIREAGEKTNTNPISIGHVLAGRAKKAGGKTWKRI